METRTGRIREEAAMTAPSEPCEVYNKDQVGKFTSATFSMPLRISLCGNNSTIPASRLSFPLSSSMVIHVPHFPASLRRAQPVRRWPAAIRPWATQEWTSRAVLLAGKGRGKEA